MSKITLTSDIVNDKFTEYLYESYDIQDRDKTVTEIPIPSDDDMIKQKIDQLISEVCMFNQPCYGFCIATDEWRNTMRQNIYNYWKNSQ